ncbi:MAG: methionyl-tRNA formyltransferase [Candidatus Buchananbacteria bacterium]|jgi:methionyl-tRNA formyltransferase
MTKPIKAVFAGTPDFSVPYMEGLLSDPDFLVLGAITQSDKPSGRKQELSPSPVKILAAKNNLKIWQPEKLRKDKSIEEELKALQADMLVVVAYGQIIPQAILDLFPKGAINVHPSLLPKYRGASPIQSALLNGEKETGISIMLMDAKMDHGPILAQENFQLNGEETNSSLHEHLAKTGVQLLIKTIKEYLTGNIKPIVQNDDEATFCTTITKEDGRLDWSQPAQIIKQKIYAFFPWPATWTTLNDKRIKIFPPVAVLKTESDQIGKLEITDSGLAVHCGENKLLLKKIQLEGKKEISAQDFARGHKDIEGKRFE